MILLTAIYIHEADKSILVIAFNTFQIGQLILEFVLYIQSIKQAYLF